MADDASPPTGHRLNPFSRRTSHSSQSILLYKVTTTLSYLLLLITAAYYTFSPVYGPNHYSRFWQIDHVYPTPFSQSATFTSIYWLILFVLQISYLAAFYSSSEANVAAAANIASHFIASNLLLFGFVNLWVREHFALAEFLLVITFANLSLAYFRHSTAPRVIHIATVSGPLAWTFVALYWVGAVAVWNLRASNIHFAARIVANVFIWGWLGYGVFFLAAYKDYTMGFALSVLSFSTATGQFLTNPHIFQLQWIFAFTIGGLLFVLSLAVGMPGLLGSDLFPRGQIVSEDRERAPLLADEAIVALTDGQSGGVGLERGGETSSLVLFEFEGDE